MRKILEKIGCHSDEISPRPLEWISQNEALNSAVPCQNKLEFWKQRQNRFSHGSLKMLVLRPVFSLEG